jgi:hypothetical protein
MTRTERLTERAITFAIAEGDEDLAVARLAFLAHGDHAAVDAAIDACLACTERTLYARWRAISLLCRCATSSPDRLPATVGRCGQPAVSWKRRHRTKEPTHAERPERYTPPRRSLGPRR